MIRQLKSIAFLAGATFLFSAFTGTHSSQPPLEPAREQPTNLRDPLLSKAWHLPRIRAFEAWHITQGRPQVTIAVIDSGIDYNHPDLNSNLRRYMKEWPPNGEDKDGNGFKDDVIGWDFVRNHYLPWDRTGHGTFVAGVAAAALDNGVGSAGVCPKCSIMPLRFIQADGQGWDEDGIAALRYAVMKRAAVINLSFAGEGYDKEYHDILKEAARRDIVVISAAGNDGENIDHESIYPPKFKELPNMIVVGGSDRSGALTFDPESKRGSNWSRHFVHLTAPGEDIIGPWLGGTYETLDGTSYSAPIVAGAAGLIRSANPKLTAPQIVNIMVATVHHTAALENKVISGGELDVKAALDCATAKDLPCLR